MHLLESGEDRPLEFLKDVPELYFFMSSPTQFKLGIMFRGPLTEAQCASLSGAMRWNQANWPLLAQRTWSLATQPAS